MRMKAAACSAGATDCGGLPVSYVYDENFGTSADGGDDIAPNRTVNGEPATLGEFTKDTVGASAESVKNAGENIGNAASKQAPRPPMR